MNITRGLYFIGWEGDGVMKCPICGSEDIRYDAIRDEYFCSVCGYVFSPGEVDIRSYSRPTHVPLGSYFKGSGRYKKLQSIDNKNDINTYRILQLQKIKSFVREYGLPDIVYEWVVNEIKKKEKGQWRFEYIVALLYLSIIKHGFYRNIDLLANHFGIKKNVLWKKIHEASKETGVNYVITSSVILRDLLKNEGDCERCCSYKILDDVGNIDLQYGSSPRVVAYTILILCKLYCNDDIALSNYMRQNKIPRNSLVQNAKRIFEKYGVVNDDFTKNGIKRGVEVILNGSCKSN